MPERQTKAAVNYREAVDDYHRCGLCRFMMMDGSCWRVEGQVEPCDVCDLWEGVVPQMRAIMALGGRTPWGEAEAAEHEGG